MQRKIKRFMFLLLMLTLTVLTVPSTAIAATDTPKADSIDAVLERINAEYGTEIRRFTSEELAQRGIESKNVVNLSDEQLINLEKKMRQIAQTVIPQIEVTNQRALEEAKKNGVSLDDLKERHKNALSKGFKGIQLPSVESVTPASTLVEATEPIDYAIAGTFAYIIEDDFGNLRWGSIESSYCYTNIYQPKWFLSTSPYSSVIDLGRTIYWTGYGDYGEYIDGVQYYIGSGTQYAYMYVGDILKH